MALWRRVLTDRNSHHSDSWSSAERVILDHKLPQIFKTAHESDRQMLEYSPRLHHAGAAAVAVAVAVAGRLPLED